MSKKIKRKKNEYGFNIIEHSSEFSKLKPNDKLLENILHSPF